MKRGLDWYKREPRAFLDGVRAARLTDREVAVYSIVLDLIYAGGGETPNDPKFIAGHFANMGAAAVRNAIQRLVEVGKLEIAGEFLTNKRARNEAKTHEKRRENAAVSGRLGGVSSGFSRRETSQNKDIAEALASQNAPLEKEVDVEKESPLPPKGDGGAPASQKPKRRKILYTPEFEEAWTLWTGDLDLEPGGKEAAAKAWGKRSSSVQERFAYAAKVYASKVAKRQRERRCSEGWNGCAMSTFLNEGRVDTHNPEKHHGQGPVQRGAAEQRDASSPAPVGPGDMGDLFRPGGGVGEDERGGDPGREAAGGRGGDPGVAVVGSLERRWREPAVRGDGGRAHLAGREPVARHRADADAGRVHRVLH